MTETAEMENLPEPEEVWKVIENFSNYEVSSLGRIRNKTTQRVRKLRFEYEGKGYLTVNLLNDEGFPQTRHVQVIVAKTFLPNLENRPEVDHIDRNRANNCVSNLRWATKKENIANSNKSLTTRCRPVLRLRKNGEIEAEYSSVLEASKHTGFHKSGIQQACAGIKPDFHGVKWVYKDLHEKVEGEIWKDYVVGQISQVSNMGRIRLISGNKITRGSKTPKGYRVTHEGSVHRLVLTVFNPHPEQMSLFVDHINEIRDDNRLENLRWATPSQNSTYAIGVEVSQYMNNELLATYDSIAEASRQTGICNSSISQCCNGKRRTSGGFVWKKSSKLIL